MAQAQETLEFFGLALIQVVKEHSISTGDLDGNLCQINLNAAGIDIGADRHWVSVPVGRDSENVRSERLFYRRPICNGRLVEAMLY